MKSVVEEQKAGGDGAAGHGEPASQARGLVLHRIIAERRLSRAPGTAGTATASVAQDIGIERAASTALGRAAEKLLHLPVFVEQVELAPMSLSELPELLPERALLAVLEGGQDSLGVMALCPGLLTSIIEMQAIGRVTSRPPANRRPTRTDAAISADFVNALLTELGRETAGRPEFPAFASFRYATYMDDPRPLSLMLEDGEMQRLRLKFRVGSGGQRDVSILIALPVEPGRGRRMTPPQTSRPAAIGQNTLPAAAPATSPAAQVAQAVQETLAEIVQQAPIHVVGILCRRKLSMQALRALGPGSLIPLPQNALDDARLETSQGQLLARGRLGEAEGFHAIRLRSADASARIATPPAESMPGPDTAKGTFGPIGALADRLPPLPEFEPPLTDLDAPDAFRDIVTTDGSRVRGHSRG